MRNTLINFVILDSILPTVVFVYILYFYFLVVNGLFDLSLTPKSETLV